MVKSLVIMRHAEREDRAFELEGKDWISTAIRPQDPVLSIRGREQAKSVGEQLLGVGVTKILCSPMIRCVESADLIAEQLGLGENSVCVEMGLVEESKSFRGKTAAEPRPNWSPLVLPVSDLKQYSSRIDESYVSLHQVVHVRDESRPNTVREVHDSITDINEITRDRCKTVLKKMLASDDLKDDIVLCVGHGATAKDFSKALETELPEELKCKGERIVSCFTEFRPVTEGNVHGPWQSVTGFWASGDDSGECSEKNDC